MAELLYGFQNPFHLVGRFFHFSPSNFLFFPRLKVDCRSHKALVSWIRDRSALSVAIETRTAQQDIASNPGPNTYARDGRSGTEGTLPFCLKRTGPGYESTQDNTCTAVPAQQAKTHPKRGLMVAHHSSTIILDLSRQPTKATPVGTYEIYVHIFIFQLSLLAFT